jgi:TPR repeat protein
MVGETAFSAELLTNSGFENPKPGYGWTIQTSLANQIDSWYTIKNHSGAHAGSRYKYLGATNNRISAAHNVDATLYQTVTIPYKSKSATLSYYLKITTKESPAQAADHLFVEIRDSNGKLLSTLGSYSNRDAQQFSVWTQQIVDLTHYAGKIIQIAFYGTTNSSIKTVFRIDDVSLQTSGTTPVQVNEFLNLNDSSTVVNFESNTTSDYGSVTGSHNITDNSNNTLTQLDWSGLTTKAIYNVTNNVVPDINSYVSFTTLFVTRHIRAHPETEVTLSEGMDAYQKGDYRAAERKFMLLAAKGNAIAQFNLGTIHELGQGVRQDHSKAVTFYRQAATQGHVKAQLRLGLIYAQGEELQQDYKEASSWFHKAAEQGEPLAQFNLGIMYALGESVLQDEQASALWFIQSAEQNNDMAQFNLGVIFAEGVGVEQSYTTAVKWYEKSAAQGNAAAQYNLAHIYREGEIIPQDHNVALSLFQKSADQGNDLAQFELGVMYTFGEGLKRNFVQAYRWFTLSSMSSSNEVAISQRNLIQSRMSAEEIEQAEALVQAWLDKRAPLIW